MAYRERLQTRRRHFEPTLLSLGESMRDRLDRYYSALNGTYVYEDKHRRKDSSRRFARARTYGKRLEFARNELAGIEGELHASLESGQLDDSSARAISNYAKSLYIEAISNNSYFQRQRRLDVLRKSSQVRDSIGSLESMASAYAPEALAFQPRDSADVSLSRSPYDDLTVKIREERHSLAHEKARKRRSFIQALRIPLISIAGAALLGAGALVGAEIIGRYNASHSNESHLIGYSVEPPKYRPEDDPVLRNEVESLMRNLHSQRYEAHETKLLLNPRNAREKAY